MSYLGMQYQANRLATFENGVREGKNKKRQYWTYELPDRHHLAEFGFYFTPTKVYNDQITCFCCKKKEKNIEGVENIAEYHLKNNPKCAFAHIIMAQYNHSIEGSDAFWQSDQAEVLREPFSRSAVALRRRTFGKYWRFDNGAPVSATSQALAKAGFFYCPVDQGDDRTQCVYCKFCLEGWSEEDDPLEEHRKYQSDCYLLHCALKLPVKQTTKPMRRHLREGSASLSEGEGMSNATTDGEFSDANFTLADNQLKVDQALKIQATDEASAVCNLSALEEPEEEVEPRRKSRRLHKNTVPDTSQEEGHLSLLLSDTETKLESRVYGSKRKRRRATPSLSERNGVVHDSLESDKDLLFSNKLGPAEEQSSINLSSQQSTEANKVPESSSDEIYVSESTRNVETSASFAATESGETDSPISEDSSFEPSTKRRKSAKKPAKKDVSKLNSTTSKPQSQKTKAKDPFETSFDETRFNDVLKSPKKASKIKLRSRLSQQPELDIERNLGDYDDNHLNSIEHEVGHIFNGSAVKVEKRDPKKMVEASKEKQKRNVNLDSSLHDISGGIFDLEKSSDENKKRQLEYNLVIKDESLKFKDATSQEHMDRDHKTMDFNTDENNDKLFRVASPNNASEATEPKEAEEIPPKSTSRYYTSLFSDSSSEASFRENTAPRKVDSPLHQHESDPKDKSEHKPASKPASKPDAKPDPESGHMPDPMPDPKSDRNTENTSKDSDEKSAHTSDKFDPSTKDAPSNAIGEISKVHAKSPISPSVSNDGHESSKSASEESKLTAPNNHSSATSKNASSALINAEIQEKNRTSTAAPTSVNHSLVRLPVEMPNKERYRSSPILESSVQNLRKLPAKSPHVNSSQIDIRKSILPELSSKADFAAEPSPTHISTNKEPGGKPAESPDHRNQKSETLLEQIDRFSASFSNVLEASTPQKKVAAGLQSWVSRPLSQLLEVIDKLEGASEYLTNIVSSEYDLHNDFDGRLTSFISSMPEEEEDMTIQEWVKHNASMCRKVAKETCNSLIETYREEFNRALRILESLPTLDSPE